MLAAVAGEPQTLTASSDDTCLASVALVAEGESSSFSAQNSNKGGGKSKPPKFGISVTPINPSDQGLVTTEPGGTAEFEVVLQSQPTDLVTVPVESNDSSEGTTNVDFLVFTPIDWDQPQRVQITGVQDDLWDGAVSYQILLAPAISGDTNYNGLDPDDVDVRNLDDDSQSLYVSGFEAITRERGRRVEVQFVVDVRIDSADFGKAGDDDGPAVGATIVLSVYNSAVTELNNEYNIRNFVGTTDSNGRFRTYWDRFDSGDFRVEVHDVILAGHMWDPTDVLELGFDDDDDDGRPDFLLSL